MADSAGQLRAAIERALAAADADDLCPTLQMGILAHQLAVLVAGQPHQAAHFDELLDRVLTSLDRATRAERAALGEPVAAHGCRPPAALN